MTTPLVLLSEVKLRLNTTTNDTQNNTLLSQIIREESAHLQQLCERRFDERIDTLHYDAIPARQDGPIMNNGLELSLGDDLKQVIQVTNGDGSHPAVIELPRRTFPKAILRISDGSTWLGGASPYDAISVTGVWGYGGSWLATGGALNADLNDSSTALTVTDSTLFEVGMVLKLDDEYLYVTATTPPATLTVQRGYNGSTAAAHANGTPIPRFAADDLVQALVRRLIAWRLEQDKAPLFGQAVVGDFSIPVSTDSVPRDVTAAIVGAYLKRVINTGAI